MSQKHILSMTYLSVLFIILWSSKTFACELSVRVGDYAPEYVQNEQGEWTGLAVDLAKTLLDEAGCKPSFRLTSWSRAKDGIKNGYIDMIMNFSKTPKRETYAYFIGPQKDESMVLVVLDDPSIKIDSLDDIKTLNGQIAIEKGGIYGQEFSEKFANDKDFSKHFKEMIKPKDNINRMKIGAIVGYIDDYDTAVYQLAENELEGKFKIYPNSDKPLFINQDWVYFGFSKESVSKELFLQLHDAYERAKNQGKFDAVLEKYRHKH